MKLVENLTKQQTNNQRLSSLIIELKSSQRSEKWAKSKYLAKTFPPLRKHVSPGEVI